MGFLSSSRYGRFSVGMVAIKVKDLDDGSPRLPPGEMPLNPSSLLSDDAGLLF